MTSRERGVRNGSTVLEVRRAFLVRRPSLTPALLVHGHHDRDHKTHLSYPVVPTRCHQPRAVDHDQEPSCSINVDPLTMNTNRTEGTIVVGPPLVSVATSCVASFNLGPCGCLEPAVGDD